LYVVDGLGIDTRERLVEQNVVWLGGERARDLGATAFTTGERVAASVADVCDAINATGFGLTLGLHTRIETTVDEVRARVRVGNMYVNRNQIGAVVGVQPFGGEGLSGTGPKAGGPHYLSRFATERVCSIDTTASGGNAALMSMESGDRGNS